MSTEHAGVEDKMVSTTERNTSTYTYATQTYSGLIVDVPVFSWPSSILRCESPSTTTTLGFLTRDPIGYVDGSNRYAAFFPPDNLDPSGTKSVWVEKSPIDVVPITIGVDLNPTLSCSQRTAKVRLDFKVGVTNVCCGADGYIVQRVSVCCETRPCPCTKATIANSKRGECFSYFEAKKITAAELAAGSGVFHDHISAGDYGGKPNTCGKYTQKGMIKFFCANKILDTGRDVGAEIGWWDKGPIAYGSDTACPTLGGQLSTRNTPDFWNGDGDAKTNASRSADYRWCCCGRTNDFFTVSTTYTDGNDGPLSL